MKKIKKFLDELKIDKEQKSVLLESINDMVNSAVKNSLPQHKTSKFGVLKESASKLLKEDSNFQKEFNLLKESVEKQHKVVDEKVNTLITESASNLNSLVNAAKADAIIAGLQSILKVAGIETQELLSESDSNVKKNIEKVKKYTRLLSESTSKLKSLQSKVTSYKESAKSLVTENKMLREKLYKLEVENILLAESKRFNTKHQENILLKEARTFVKTNPTIDSLKKHIKVLRESIERENTTTRQNNTSRKPREKNPTQNKITIDLL